MKKKLVYHINSGTKFWTSGINQQGGTTLVVATQDPTEEIQLQKLGIRVGSPAYPSKSATTLDGFHVTTSTNARRILGLGEGEALPLKQEYSNPNFLFQHAGLYAINDDDNDVPMAWGLGAYFFTDATKGLCYPHAPLIGQVRTMLRCELPNVDQFVFDTKAGLKQQMFGSGRLEDRKNVYTRWQVWVEAISEALNSESNSKQPEHSKLVTQAITEMIRMHDVRRVGDILVVMRPGDVIRKCWVVEADYRCPPKRGH